MKSIVWIFQAFVSQLQGMLVYTVQQGKPPVVPSDLSFAAKDHHCTQGPGDKGGSQEIGACTPKQQVIFDLV